MVGAVLIPGASAPKLVRREMIASMKRGSVVVDVAIDQGGCFETSHATTHTDPIYFVDGVLHYCVSNMPAAVPHTSTFALTNATFPYLLELANQGSGDAPASDHPGLRDGREYLSRLRDARRRGGIAGPASGANWPRGVSCCMPAARADRSRPLPLTALSEEERLFQRHRAQVRARADRAPTSARWTRPACSARTSSGSSSNWA